MTTNPIFKPLILLCLVVACSSISKEQSFAQAPKKPAAEPAIPGIPELPPGIELPADVKEQLKKALQQVKDLEDSAKKKAPPTTKPIPPATTKPIPPVKTSPATKPGTTPAATPKSSAPALPPSVAASTAFKRVAVEKKLGSIGDVNFAERDNKKPTFWVSPDGRRIAYLIDKGIAIDGTPHQFKNSIRQADQFIMNFRFSPDSQRTAFVVHQGGGQGPGEGETLVLDGVPEKVGWNFIANHDGAVFSPDGKHVAYIARRYAKSDVEYVLMIDGVEREVFKESPAWKMTFSADSRRVIWAEDVGEHYEMRETSVDGTEPRVDRKFGPARLTMDFFYGSDGQVCYVASDPDRQQFVVIDGQEQGPRFKALKDIFISPDCKHFAYVAEPESFRSVVVLDGKPSKTYGGLEADLVDNSLVLSPVGGRAAYAIKKRGVQHVVVDGKEGKGYSGVAELTFSPDGKLLAHWAAQGGKIHTVVNGQEGGAYDELGLPVFNPDSNVLAYGAGLGDQKFIVVNGKKQKAYAYIGEPEFSPDGKRLVYIADLTLDGPSILVDSGNEGKQYDGIKEDLYFSSQGERLALVAFTGDDEMVVVDGVEGNRYDKVITLGGGKVQFDAADRFHYLAVKDGDLYLVEETIE